MKVPRHSVVSILVASSFALIPTLLMGGGTMAKSRPLATRKTTNLSWFTDVSWWSVPGWKANTNGPVYKTITDKFGLTFTTQVPPTSADSKLSLMLTTGQLPDIITLQNASEMSQVIQSGRAWNLTQFFQKYDPAFLKANYPLGLGKGVIAQQEHTFGGFYGIPNYEEAPDMFKGTFAKVKAQVLYGTNSQIVFNQPLMKEAGITLQDVRTASGLLKALEKVNSMHLKVNGAPVIPLQVDTASNWPSVTLNSLAQMFGAMPVTKSGNYRPLRLSPEMKTTIDYLHTLAAKGLLSPDEFTLDTTGVENVVQSGRVFAFLGNTGNPNWAGMYDANHNDVVVSPGNHA